MLAFLLKYPKLIASGLAVTIALSFFAHYKYMQHKIDKLETEKAAFEFALEKAATNMRLMEADARVAAEATATVMAERNAARHALDDLRRGRENDPEAQAWAAEPIPLTELARLCEALPNMDGCELFQ